MVWHDGPDFTRLVGLARSTPAEVARMLTAGVEAGDPLAAQSIAALADADLVPDGAEALLRAVAPTATELMLVRVAQALHVLTGEESWATPIATVLTSEAFWGVRIDAAMALAAFTPTPALLDALARGVRDDEYLVRYHSANTLLRYAGDSKEISDHPDLFDKVTSDADAAGRAELADQLTSAIKP